jgi:hypothetical protein
MLCFGTSDQEDFKVPLAALIERGFLIDERFRGGYSLTEEGFKASQELRRRSDS